ncbi:MAG: glycosyltransferase family 2 protein [Promethearchaeota archaeon]
MKPDVSIVIRTKNEEKDLPHLLKSIRLQKNNKPYEIILVDSGSTDKTLEIAQKNDIAIFHIPRQDFTYGYALNIGVKHAKGDIIIFVSAHVSIMDKNWLENLISPLKDNSIQCTYGKLIGNKNQNPFENIIWRNMFPDKNMLFTKSTNLEKLSISNSNAAYKKAFLLNNKFNEKIPYAEDFLMGMEIIKKGYKIMYVSDASIIHSHPFNFKNNIVLNFKAGFSNLLINALNKEKKKNIFRLFLNNIKDFFLEFVYLLKKLISNGNYKTIIKLFFYEISRLNGKLTGELKFYCLNYSSLK